jgi:hypothetical protein
MQLTERATSRLHLQGRRVNQARNQQEQAEIAADVLLIFSSTLKMETRRSSELHSVTTAEENLKSELQIMFPFIIYPWKRLGEIRWFRFAVFYFRLNYTCCLTALFQL